MFVPHFMVSKQRIIWEIPTCGYTIVDFYPLLIGHWPIKCLPAQCPYSRSAGPDASRRSFSSCLLDAIFFTMDAASCCPGYERKTKCLRKLYACTRNAQDGTASVCQTLSWWMKYWPYSISIWDTFTNVVPLHSDTKRHHMSLLLQMFAYLNILFILEMACTAGSAGHLKSEQNIQISQLHLKWC